MKISITCGLSNQATVDFTEPISEIRNVARINLFRKSETPSIKKVSNYKINKSHNWLMRNFFLLYSFFKNTNSRTSLAIGIYEIPFGLVAFFVGKIRSLPVCICVIGNPGYSPLRSGLRKWFTFILLRNSDYVTVCGSNSLEYLVKNNIQRDKIFVLPNSINIKNYSNLKSKKIYDLISIGRLSSEKRLDTLLEIVNNLKKSNPEISLAIGGQGPEKISLIRKVKDLNLEDNVIFLGFVEDIERFYNQGKVLVITSETEGLPRTALESISCGTPVVFPNVGDMKDLNKSEIYELMVESCNDKKGYCDVLESLLLDDNLYSKVSLQYQDFVQKEYNHTSAMKVWKVLLGIKT